STPPKGRAPAKASAPPQRRAPAKGRAPARGRGPAGRDDAAVNRRALDRVDGRRGQRDGTAVRRSQQRARRRRRAVGALVGTVLAVGVMYVALFPGSTLLTQRASTAKAEAELREVRKEREAVRRESELLTTDQEIEKQAREDFAMKHPDQEIVNVLPLPTEPIGLPDTWPFIGVEEAFGAS
ncbi:MAG: hypothetical protein JWM47_2382, partial [Acidimicrobiales bacterium]|nr:hypothetical protein [Acidimicrobiales bacterium]